MRTSGGLAIVDATTGAWTRIAAQVDGKRYRLSDDARKLKVEREFYDGDVWLLDFKTAATR